MLAVKFCKQKSPGELTTRCMRHRIEEIAETQKDRKRLLLLYFAYVIYRRNKERAEVSRRFSSISVFSNSEEEKSVARATKLTAPTSDPRTWNLAAPTTLPCGSTHNQARRDGASPLPRFDFMLSSVEPRSKIMFLSTLCQSVAKQTTNIKSPNLSFRILPFFLWYFQKHSPKMNIWTFYFKF